MSYTSSQKGKITMGRPKGSKNKPKNLLAHMHPKPPLTEIVGGSFVGPDECALPKKRGRPVGSKNKPKEKGATVSFLPPTIRQEEPLTAPLLYGVKCQVSRLGLDLSAVHPDHLIGKWEPYHTAMDVRNLVVSLCVDAVRIVREVAVKQ